MSEAAGTLAGGSGLSEGDQRRGQLHLEAAVLIRATLFINRIQFLTNNSEVECGLTEAVAVLQLDGVAATVLLLSTSDGQFTAAVIALYGRIR